MVGGTSTPSLVGRDEELVLIADVLDAARRGRRAALCMRGEPGVGKSALLAAARAIASDFTVLSTRGTAGVGELAFSGVSDLVGPLSDATDRLSDAHRVVLRAALGIERGEVHPLAIAAAFLDLLSLAASRGPVLVMVDDLGWVDRSSREVVLFAARRLDADGVAFLFTTRDDDRETDVTSIDELPVVGLSVPAARALLADDVVPAVAEHVHAATGGNVLAMLEYAATLDDLQRTGRAPIPERVLVGPRLRRAFERRVRHLPSETQRALQCVAADWTCDAAVVVDALTRLGLPEDALVVAERAGIVRVGETVEFAHPLVRATVAETTAPPDRRAAHGALADAFAAVRDGDRAVWHRAESCIGTNDETAAALHDVAVDARRRGAQWTAARAFERAARLSRSDDLRARRLFAAGETLWIAGRSERAVGLFAEALLLADDDQLRADIAVLAGQAEMWANGPTRARAFLLEEARRVEPVDPERATLLLTHAVTASLLACDVPTAIASGLQARAAAERSGPAAQLGAAVALGTARLHQGDADAAALLEPATQIAASVSLRDVPEALNLVVALGLTDLFGERWDRAQRFIDGVIAHARLHGLVGMLPFSLAVRADLHWRRGEWRQAALAIRSILELVEGSEKIAGSLWAEALLARVEAGLGREQACRRRAEAARARGNELGMEAIVIFAESALGLLELGMGHFDAAFRPLAEVERLMREGEVGEPGVLWWAGDYIDAARRSGRVREAASVLRALERQASATGSVWAHAVAARGRGSLAGAATYAQEFDDALVRHCELDAPFELARTQLAYAERLSEYEEREVAARHAEKARELFDRIGAAPWAARAGVLTGSSAQPHRSVRDVLTDREFEVASVVGRGASNQEAAAELFLSVKTIDFHLRNAYRKLGLTSRTQLAVVLERQGLLSSAP